MGKYNKEFIVPYYDCNKFGYIKPEALLEYLVETSSLHSDSIGLGFEELMEKNYGWILSKWKVKIFIPPKAMDRISIETWSSGFNKFYAYREFNVYNEHKNLIAKASTLWIFMDTQKKRPIRIPNTLYSNYNPIEERNFNEFFNPSHQIRTDSSMDFRVRKTDIDYNEHVNNAKYLNWFLEVIPLKIDEDYYLSELDIYYKKEVKYDHIVESKISEKKELKDGVEFLHQIYNKNTSVLTTQARTVWSKKV